MSHYVPAPLLRAVLQRQGVVEQFLGGFLHEEGPAIRWLELRLNESGVEVSIYEALDEGDEDFFDVYSFAGLNDGPGEPDDPIAEHDCDTLEEALALAADLYGAGPEGFVMLGMVQGEYAEFLARGRRNA